MRYEINFYLDNSKLDSSFIILAITCDDGRMKHSTNVKIPTSQWKPSLEDIRLPVLDMKRICDLRDWVTRYIQEYQFRNWPIYKADLKNYLLEKENKNQDSLKRGGSIISEIDTIIKKAKDGDIVKISGKKYSNATLSVWTKANEKLSDFTTAKKMNIGFATLTVDKVIDPFIKYCNDQNMKVGSINAYIGCIKTIMGIALRLKLHNNLEVKNIPKLKMEAPYSVSLNDDEISSIETVDLSGMEKEIRDRYLINLFTGLRISDFKELTDESIKDNKITLMMKKTDKKVSIPVHKKIRAIIDNYDGKMPKQYHETTVNKVIKQICKKAGINSIEVYSEVIGGKTVKQRKPKWQMISNHTARRSMVTNMHKKGVEDSKGQKIVGLTPQTYSLYNKVTAEENAESLESHEFFNS